MEAILRYLKASVCGEISREHFKCYSKLKYRGDSGHSNVHE
jgi:hypothetical protein